MPSDDALTRVLSLSRRVATQQGADLYNKPIGSIIGPDSKQAPGSTVTPPAPDTSSMPKNAPGRTTGAPERVGDVQNKTQKRPVTIERLRSLQRQLRIAQKADNSAGVKAASKQFNEAMSEFVKTRSPEEVAQMMAGPK